MYLSNEGVFFFIKGIVSIEGNTGFGIDRRNLPHIPSLQSACSASKKLAIIWGCNVPTIFKAGLSIDTIPEIK